MPPHAALHLSQWSPRREGRKRLQEFSTPFLHFTKKGAGHFVVPRNFIAAARAASDRRGLSVLMDSDQHGGGGIRDPLELQSLKIARARILKIDVIQARGKDPYPGKFIFSQQVGKRRGSDDPESPGRIRIAIDHRIADRILPLAINQRFAINETGRGFVQPVRDHAILGGGTPNSFARKPANARTARNFLADPMSPPRANSKLPRQRARALSPRSACRCATGLRRRIPPF